MENFTPIEIANKIIEISGLDIFKNTRASKYVAHRALLTHLLRNRLSMRWTNIALFFTKNGKPMIHSNAIYLNNQYESFKKPFPHLDEIEKMFTFKSNLNYDEIDRVHYLENKCVKLEEKNVKLNDLLNHPMYKVIHNVPENLKDEIGAKLKLWEKSLEWKKELI
tara:strand:- start:5905 stop:6399 length:495 start_codon:yes stop_codon:yes gene_type:complete